MHARKTAHRAAEIVDHPSDLAVLFLANVWDVALPEQLLAIVRRPLKYHSGLPYRQEQPRPRDDAGQNIY